MKKKTKTKNEFDLDYINIHILGNYRLWIELSFYDDTTNGQKKSRTDLRKTIMEILKLNGRISNFGQHLLQNDDENIGDSILKIGFKIDDILEFKSGKYYRFRFLSTIILDFTYVNLLNGPDWRVVISSESDLDNYVKTLLEED